MVWHHKMSRIKFSLEEDTPNFFECLYDQRRFQKEKNFYEWFSKEIKEGVNLFEVNNGVAFKFPEKEYLDFKVHDLQIKDPAEVIYWHAAAKKGEEVSLEGVYKPNILFERGSGLFRGKVRGKEKQLEVLVKNNNLVDLRNNGEINLRTITMTTILIGPIYAMIDSQRRLDEIEKDIDKYEL
jgi:hypothetical protein